MTATSLLLPVGYVSILAIIFALFARYNRARQLKANKKSSYFSVHVGKYEYEELAEQYSPDDDFGKQILMSALMRRAMEDIRRALKIREEKPSLQQVVREGIVGEDLWDKIVKAEQELEDELQQVMDDAEIYKEGWGKGILQEASQLTQMHIQQIHQMEAQARAQAEAVEKQRLEQLEKGDSSNSKSAGHFKRSNSEKENAVPNQHDVPDEKDREAIERELLEEEAREARKSVQGDSDAKPKGGKSGRRKKK